MIVMVGCDSGHQTTVERVSVSGTVTLDGQPLEAGAIVFHCAGQAPDGVAITAFGFIENGSFDIDADDGPAVGSARVEFRPKPLQREALEEAVDQAAMSRTRRTRQTTIVEIPAQYGEDSELQVELAPGKNRQDFHLDSRP